MTIAFVAVIALCIVALVLSPFFKWPCGHFKTLEEVSFGGDHHCAKVVARSAVTMIALAVSLYSSDYGQPPETIDDLRRTRALRGNDPFERLSDLGYDFDICRGRNAVYVLCTDKSGEVFIARPVR